MRCPVQINGQHYLEHVRPSFTNLALDSKGHKLLAD